MLKLINHFLLGMSILHKLRSQSLCGVLSSLLKYIIRNQRTLILKGSKHILFFEVADLMGINRAFLLLHLPSLFVIWRLFFIRLGFRPQAFIVLSMFDLVLLLLVSNQNIQRLIVLSFSILQLQDRHRRLNFYFVFLLNLFLVLLAFLKKII